jgi:hypothetical protein
MLKNFVGKIVTIDNIRYGGPSHENRKQGIEGCHWLIETKEDNGIWNWYPSMFDLDSLTKKRIKLVRVA